MTIESVTVEDYNRVISNPYHIFGSAHFNNLNREKANPVYYLLFKDSKYRLGLIAGKNDEELRSPFSAPFGGFSFIHEDIRITAVEEAVELTEDWCKQNQLTGIRYTLPPLIYGESFISKVTNVMYRKGYVMENLDLNFHFDLVNFTSDYIQNIWHNARKNLNIALTNNLSFRTCDTLEERETAYDVIAKNRISRGRPLRMTWEQVITTADLVPAHFFLAFDADRNPLAAAIVFIISTKIAQVIYWGDLPGYQHLKPMNFLSYKVFEFFHQKGFRTIDIGISTENSVPNYGLCEFKESLGCNIQPKVTFAKSFI
jgi:hypothetical protein